MAASIIGSIVGLGGGFLIVPVLRIAFSFSPSLAAGSSLVLVLANASGATASYYRQGVLDLRIGLIIGLGGIPGSVAGAIAVRHFTSNLFDYFYGAFLLLIAADVMRRKIFDTRDRAVPLRAMMAAQSLLFAGFIVGFVSSFFGIGGGMIVLPLLLWFSNLSPAVIVATSSFVIFLTAPAGVLTHALHGDVHLAQAVPLAMGGVVGGQIGAGLARRFTSKALLGLLAATLAAAALALVLRHLR